ncbi:MAG TPA: MscL family protein [bacterium]|nr:MscL family protein [bacterium]HPV65532.1 MscL family protein [bacterium]
MEKNDLKIENSNLVDDKLQTKTIVHSRFLKGLIDFLKEYSVIGLAIGVVVGQTSKDLVDSLVKGIFMPIVELLVSKDKFDNLVFSIKNVSFDVGSVLSSFITFLIVMSLLYFIVKKIIKNDNFLPKK